MGRHPVNGNENISFVILKIGRLRRMLEDQSLKNDGMRCGAAVGFSVIVFAKAGPGGRNP